MAIPSEHDLSTGLFPLPKLTQDTVGVTQQAAPKALASIVQGRGENNGVESSYSRKNSVKRRLYDDLVVEPDGDVDNGGGSSVCVLSSLLF